MVFKAVAGVRIRNGVRRSRAAGFIWKDTSTYNEKNRSVLDVTNRVKAFYKNRIVLSSNWPKFRPRQVSFIYAKQTNFSFVNLLPVCEIK